MRTNLAYLNEAVHTAVERQIENPLSPPDVAHAAQVGAKRRIAGITVVDGSALTAASTTRREALEGYQRDAEQLRERLAAAGVEHLTVWPVAAWKAVARETRLYCFQPEDDGTVAVAAEPVFERIGAEARRGFSNAPLVGAALGASLGVLSAFVVGWFAVPLAFAGMLAGGMLAESVYFKHGRARPGPYAERERRLIRRLFSKKPSELASFLWPDHVEPEGGLRIGITLPDAPELSQQNLARAAHAGFELTLYTVSEALAFTGDTAAPFITERAKVWSEMASEMRTREAQAAEAAERRRQRLLDAWSRLWPNDPIVTTTHGSAIAIIVQYGDFPVERAVVDRVLNSSALV